MVCSTKFLVIILASLCIIHFFVILCPNIGQNNFGHGKYSHIIRIRERYNYFKTKILVILRSNVEDQRISTGYVKSTGENISGCHKKPNGHSFISRIKKHRVNIEEVNFILKKYCQEKVFPVCNISTHGTRITINNTLIMLKELYGRELNFVYNGGWWQPRHCIESATTAIIIPFRRRYQHLPILLRHLHPFLKRQKMHYRIFLVEQDDQNGFNRGKLMNIGYREALKIFPYKCFVFHDVDLLPEDNRINYRCKHSPMHLSAAVNKFNYELPYTDIFGGVEMFTADDFRKTNGFSNLFYTWGGEDDNLLDRVRKVGMKVYRPSLKIARYTMLAHKAIVEADRSVSERRLTFKLMNVAKEYSHLDGLSSLKYQLNKVEVRKLFTLIKVDLLKKDEKYFGVDV